MSMRFCFAPALTGLALILSGCTTVHTRADTSATLEAPARLVRLEEAESARRIIHLVDPAREAVAEVYAVEPVFGEVLLPLAFQELFEVVLQGGVEGAPVGAFRFRSEAGSGWAYGANVENGSLFLVVRSEREEAGEALFLRLLDGFSYARGEGPQGLDLASHVAPAVGIEISPVDAQGSARQGWKAPVSIPSALSRGYVLSEPLTRSTTAQEYLIRVARRSGIDDSSLQAVEGDLCDDCAAFFAGNEILAARISQEKLMAFQFRLWTPEAAVDHIEVERKLWIEEFLSDPEALLGQEGP
jgi:hypothetical protein